MSIMQSFHYSLLKIKASSLNVNSQMLKTTDDRLSYLSKYFELRWAKIMKGCTFCSLIQQRKLKNKSLQCEFQNVCQIENFKTNNCATVELCNKTGCEIVKICCIMQNGKNLLKCQKLIMVRTNKWQGRTVVCYAYITFWSQEKFVLFVL